MYKLHYTTCTVYIVQAIATTNNKTPRVGFEGTPVAGLIHELDPYHVQQSVHFVLCSNKS